MSTRPRFYDELAHWWPLFSPPDDYDAEALDLLQRLGPLPADRRPTLLELGAGGGNLASHLAPHFALTLTDRAPAMLAVSATLNPEAEHLVGDMQTLRLDRQFDVVLVHDAIMYATTPDAVRAALRTAVLHCRTDGVIAILPDYLRETFTEGTEADGTDGPDGRGLRYLEWRWDPDPTDGTYLVDYAFLLRDSDGRITVEHDRHMEGLFSLAQWHEWLDAAGLTFETAHDPWDRQIFIARPKH